MRQPLSLSRAHTHTRTYSHTGGTCTYADTHVRRRKGGETAADAASSRQLDGAAAATGCSKVGIWLPRQAVVAEHLLPVAIVGRCFNQIVSERDAERHAERAQVRVSNVAGFTRTDGTRTGIRRHDAPACRQFLADGAEEHRLTPLPIAVRAVCVRAMDDVGPLTRARAQGEVSLRCGPGFAQTRAALVLISESRWARQSRRRQRPGRRVHARRVPAGTARGTTRRPRPATAPPSATRPALRPLHVHRCQFVRAPEDLAMRAPRSLAQQRARGLGRRRRCGGGGRRACALRRGGAGPGAPVSFLVSSGCPLTLFSSVCAACHCSCCVWQRRCSRSWCAEATGTGTDTDTGESEKCTHIHHPRAQAPLSHCPCDPALFPCLRTATATTTTITMRTAIRTGTEKGRQTLPACPCTRSAQCCRSSR